MSSTDPLRVTPGLLPRDLPATTRRTALRSGALALTALAASGCDTSATDREAAPSPPASGDPAASEPDDDVADAELAVEALGLVDATLAVVTAAATRHPSIAPLVQALAGDHEAHRALLADAAPGAGAPTPATSPPDVARAWSALRRREERLQAELGALALRAGSGTFARVLAVMTASVAQHLAALPATLPPAPGRVA